MTQQKRREVEEAMQEMHRCTVRMGVIDAEIEEERQAISRQRVAAAKRGESPVFAVDRVGLEGLQAERDELPELHFVTRIRAAAVHVALEKDVQEELAPRVEEARTELAPLEAAAAETQALADEAAQKLAQLEGAVLASQERSKMHEDLLRQIEAEGVKPLY